MSPSALETLIEEKGGEFKDQIQFGFALARLRKKEFDELVSELSRRPKSGGAQKIREELESAVEGFELFFKMHQPK